MRLLNDLGYSQLSNPNWLLKVVMMCERNDQELLRYFYYLGQGFHHISLLNSEVDKPYDVFIKTSNAAEYIELDIQKIEAPRIDDPLI